MIAVYIVTKNMTVEQHSKGRDRLREAGAPERAMKLHSCFGEDGQLQVFDVWESQEAFDRLPDVPWAGHGGTGHRVGATARHHADCGPCPAITSEGPRTRRAPACGIARCRPSPFIECLGAPTASKLRENGTRRDPSLPAIRRCGYEPRQLGHVTDAAVRAVR